MSDQLKFNAELDKSYRFEGSSIVLGAGVLDGMAQINHLIRVPLQTMNRHGLIAGATGTGKTKTLQLLAEGLSSNGVPVLMMDIKGDLSGIAKAGEHSLKIEERASKTGVPWVSRSFPGELLSLSAEPGLRLRATVSEFGPVLFSKILGLNNTQESVMAIIFKYADDKNLPLLDLQDLKALLQYMGNEGREEVQRLYGNISSATIATILRKIIELEQQKADAFFGEPSFDPNDLLRMDAQGKGYCSIIRLTDIQDRPKLFSTFMLSLLAEIYNAFPETGDAGKPKLVIFIDEAHLIFKEATRELLSQIETTIKLIRSKGVGVFFCTQNPQDIPATVLSQLGLKIQHALRAFTAGDRNTIKKAAENFPESEYYEVSKILTEMGIGEALVSVLNEKGIPTMLVHTLILPPASRMDILSVDEINELVKGSALVRVYNQTLDRQSAFEILQQRIENSSRDGDSPDDKQVPAPSNKTDKAKNAFDKMLRSPVVRSVGVTIANALTRSILGSLGIKTRRTSGTKKYRN